MRTHAQHHAASGSDAITKTPLDLTGVSQQDIAAIQKLADASGRSFDDECKHLLLQHARQLRAQHAQPRAGMFSRLFSRSAAH